MRYFGSKASVLEDLYRTVSKVTTSGTFCDPFGGIATVGSFFKAQGYQVITGDILTAAHYFQIARVQSDRTPAFTRLKEHLSVSSASEIVEFMNTARSRPGWLTRRFSDERNFFVRENAIRIDTCRLLISHWTELNIITPRERAILLASLINSMDKVANTAGTYYAYLKHWYRKALRPFRFELIPRTIGSTGCQCFLGTAEDLVKQQEYDILYLDPPYNERSYGAYYHLPESLALGITPRAFGKSGVPHSARTRSDFNRTSDAENALGNLLAAARFKQLIFHYSDDGLISPSNVIRILSDYGAIRQEVLDAQGYSTDRVSKRVKHRLYIVTNG